MSARPILFSPPMVRALLSDQKTQTRRIMKPQPPEGWKFSGFNIDDDALFYPPTISEADMAALKKTDPRFRCPYGRPGDLLWVRESIDGLCGCDAEYVADGQRLVDAHPAKWDIWQDKRDLPLRTIPSIHMPRWASRLTLELTEVRVERLQDIDQADALAEGVEYFKTGDPYEGDLTYHFKDYLCKGIIATDEDGDPVRFNNMFEDDPIASYRSLWESINGPGSWEANPWVCCLAFSVIQQNVDALLKEKQP